MWIKKTEKINTLLNQELRLNKTFRETIITVNLNDKDKSIYNYCYDYNFFDVFFFLGKISNHNKSWEW